MAEALQTGGRYLLANGGAGHNTVDCLRYLSRLRGPRPETYDVLSGRIQRVHQEWLQARGQVRGAPHRIVMTSHTPAAADTRQETHAPLLCCPPLAVP